MDSLSTLWKRNVVSAIKINSDENSFDFKFSEKNIVLMPSLDILVGGYEVVEKGVDGDNEVLGWFLCPNDAKNNAQSHLIDDRLVVMASEGLNGMFFGDLSDDLKIQINKSLSELSAVGNLV